MSWREIGKLAKTWLENEKTELLTTDHARREQATGERIRSERELKDAVGSEVGYAVLGGVLPPDLAARVEASRPENVRARRDSERREQLAGQPTGRLQLSMSGEIRGSATADLPLSVDHDPDDDEPSLTVTLESPDPIPLGTHTLLRATFTVPHYRGPGRYDLALLWQQVEAGTLPEWDLLGILFQLRDESTDEDPMWSPGEQGASVIDVTDTSLAFDLGMASAAGSSRATGRIDWAPSGS